MEPYKIFREVDELATQIQYLESLANTLLVVTGDVDLERVWQDRFRECSERILSAAKALSDLVD